MTPFSTTLRQLRTDRGIKLKVAASALNIHVTRLSAIERGRHPPPRDEAFYRRVADYFELSEFESARLQSYVKQAPLYAELAKHATPQQAEFMAWLMEQAPRLKNWEMNAIRAILDAGVRVHDEQRRAAIG